MLLGTAEDAGIAVTYGPSGVRLHVPGEDGDSVLHPLSEKDVRALHRALGEWLEGR